MKNDINKIENKLKNANSPRNQTEIKSNNKQSNNISHKKKYLSSSVNILQNKNNFNNLNHLGNNQNKNNIKIKGNPSINCKNFYHDYKTNIKELQNKPCTPITKNQKDYLGYFNFNNSKNKNEKNNNADNNDNYQRSKSTNKPNQQLKQKNVIKCAQNASNDGLKKIPSSLINQNQVQNKFKNNNNNIQNNNITTPKTKNIPSIKTSSNKNIPSIKTSSNKNIPTIKTSSNKNIINIKEAKNSNNNNLNKSINQKTQPFVSYGKSEHPNKEHREQMEDFNNFVLLSIKNIYFSYFAIFDGHTGVEVPMFLRDHYHIYLKNELESKTFTNNLETNNQLIITSIKNSFEKIDKDIINNNKFKNDNGSTGTIILLYRDINNPLTKVLICANIGDSKGFIINKNGIKQITKDHNCENATEVKRIKNSEGLIFQGRVFGSLMLTRSFGDKEYKQYGVMASPDFFCEIIKDDYLYAIIASDGVWDIVSKDNLFQLSKKNMSSVDFAKKIVVTAMEGGTRDNTSCIVIKLNSL